MQDAPERIWAVTSLGMVGSGRWVTQGTENPHGNIGYTRTDLCITEAECQRRIDAAVTAEREIWMRACGVQVGFTIRSHIEKQAAAIRARGQK